MSKPADFRRAAVAVAITTMIAVHYLTAAPQVYYNRAQPLSPGFSKRAVVVPVDSMRTRYRDNTQADPDTQFTDAFLIASANTMLRFETARLFSPVTYGEGDTQTVSSMPRYSVLEGDSADRESSAAFIRDACERYNADFAIVPAGVVAGYRVYQAEGWRHSTGPAYARPVEADGFAEVHVQIWNRDGVLLYESIAVSSVGRPILHRFFGGRRMRARFEEELQEDIVRAASHLYSPPILRALSKATNRALLVRW